MKCKHCGIQLTRIPRFGGGTWIVAVSQSATICPRNGEHEPVSPAPCRRTDAHTPHDGCPGTAPEFPGEPVDGVVRDAGGTILRGPSLPCGCPLDADCTGHHPGALS